MRFLTFLQEGQLKLGLKYDDQVLDVATVASDLGLQDLPLTPEELFQMGIQGLAKLKVLSEQPKVAIENHLFEMDDVKIGPSVPAPGKIVCVGLNYKRHALEAGMQIPSEPILFSKYGNTILAGGETVFLPKVGKEYDYEVELAFVIGKTAKNVGLDEALGYVMGYTGANDLSARDLQLRTGQWLIGKNLDGFLPVGPWFVSSDEVPSPQNLTTKCWRNGKLVQDSNTSDMIFTIAEIIVHISSLMTLKPGDLILTGTPEGVIFGMDEKIWLNENDEVTIEVGDFGKLTNTFQQ